MARAREKERPRKGWVEREGEWGKVEKDTKADLDKLRRTSRRVGQGHQGECHVLPMLEDLEPCVYVYVCMCMCAHEVYVCACQLYSEILS